MFQGGRVILKGGMDIGHTGMPGVACIRKKTEIREPEPFDHLAFCSERGLGWYSLQGGMDEHEAEQHGAHYDESREQMKFSHARLFIMFK